MAYQPPCVEPARLTAGDLVSWTRTFADFPTGEGWTLSYSLALEGDVTQPIAFSATINSGQFLVSVPASTTATWPAGTYEGQGYVTKAGGERHLVWAGRVIIDTNLNVSQIADPRNIWRKIVDYIDLNMSSLVQGQTSKATIEGVEIEFRSAKDLLDIRNYYEARALKDENAASGKQRRTILARFTAAQ